jgi:hypothetical protein
VNTVQTLLDAIDDERCTAGFPLQARLVVETPDGVGFIQGIETGRDEDGPYVVLVVRS